MQIILFTIPLLGGEAVNEEMNAFLRSKKIVQIENKLVGKGKGAFWSFCIKYTDDEAGRQRERVDYREVLDPESFKRFAAMREIRRRLAREESIPAYAIFTDEELAELAKIEDITTSKMQQVRGIGEKKVERYGHHFITSIADEKS
ncbi:MAG: HRDC domain-containing protein [Lewinellaceae bacterium]|nr:HRDC domain-containing protein [Lewinellaceae bacterium]